MRRLFFCIMLVSFAYLAMAETALAQRSSEAQQRQADETIDLNIKERRITEPNYQASTSVEIGPDQARGVWLRVGVGVFATGIDVILRNVTGRVRFRGSLESVLRRINQKRPDGAKQ